MVSRSGMAVAMWAGLLIAGVSGTFNVMAQTEDSGTASVATEPTTAADASAAPENIFPVAEDITGSGVLKDRDRYLRERGWNLGFNESNPSGSYIGWGTAQILVDPESADYGGARIAAVNSAVTEAMGQFALSEGLKAQAQTIRSVTQDPNALQREEQQATNNYAAAVFDRLTNLTTAQLDQALEKLGVDPARHADLDYSSKVTLAQQSVKRSIARQAFESFRGVRLLKTFEEEGAIGALVIYNKKFATLARRIASGEVVAIGDGVSSDAVDQIANDLSSEELLFMHGVRLLKDADGNPVIVSFGQASPSVTKADSDRSVSMAVTAAQKSAELSADAGISDFLGSQVEVEDEVISQAVAREEGQVSADRSVVTESSEYVENLNSLIRQSSRLDLSGITTVRSWRGNHPDTGHLYVGTVKMWSPAGAAAFTGAGRVSSGDDAASSEGRSVDVERRSSPEFGTEDW